jgi:thioesterase domain-containing protein/non-ribosomal peptide synthetase component F
MVPASFLTLSALPLTPNGKLDVKALPRPEAAATLFLAPRTPTETAVAQAFAEVLGLDRCGASSHFFELGGHSLLAATLTSRLRSLGVKLPLRAVFDAPTVEALARRIDLSLHDSSAAEPIFAGPRPDPLPLSLPQERLWFLDRLQRDATYNIPVAFGLRGALDTPALEAALHRIVERHEVLRSRIVLLDGRPAQQILPPPTQLLTRIDLSDSPEPDSALTRALAQLAATPLDLAAGIPLVARLYTLAPERHALGAIVHHAAFDGWSAHVFLVELQQLYAAFRAGEPDPLPPLRLQYADFALWQRAQDHGPGRSFWRETLAGAPALSQLPATLPTANDPLRPASEIRLELGPVRHAALTRLARQHNASLFFVLHAALALHLARAIGQDDLVVGTVVANRERAELEPLIGCFVNTLPLRTRLLPGDTFASLLDRVRHADLAAFAHQDQPFEEIVQLVDFADRSRALLTTPLFQVLLVLQNTPQGELTLPGLSLELLPMPSQAAQFDLTFNLTETAGTVSGVLQYAANRYDPAAMERFANGFLDLLDSISADPSQLLDLNLAPVVPAPQLPVQTLQTPVFVPPATAEEEALAALWAELLHLDRVGRHDNFFELGGHSLLTMTLIERLARQGLRLDIRALFSEPTLAGIAAQIIAIPSAAAAPVGIPLGTTAFTPEHFPLTTLTQPQIDRILATLAGGAAELQDVYPLAPLQEGLLFQHLLAPKADPYIAPFLLGFDSLERRDGFLAALNQVIGRHDVLRTAMLWTHADRPLQVVRRRATVPVTSFSPRPDEPVEAQLLGSLHAGAFRLALDTAPLMRVITAFDSAQNRWLVLLLTHHLVLDHTSMEIVVGELRALMQDPAAALPESVPYRHFVAHTLADAELPGHREFFQQMLGTVTQPTAPFGITALASNVSPAELREARLTLPSALADRIRVQAAALGVSPASLFHLAWAMVLGHVSGSRDVVFGTVLLGRMNSGAHAAQVVGMFINTLPVRVALDEPAGSAASALATHRLLQQLLLHEHAPLALVQRSSAIPAPLPLLTSLFNFRHSPEGTETTPWPGVSLLFAEERTNYPIAMAVDDRGRDFLLTAITAPAIDPERLCDLLDRAVASLLSQLTTAPQTPLPLLPLPPVALAAPVAPATISARPVPYVAPRGPAEAALQQIWQRLLELPAPGIHDDFFLSGGDSLTAMRLLSAVHTTLGVELPMRALLEAPTIAGLAARLTSSPDGTGDRLVGLQPHGTRTPLFCIHPAGGYVFCYLPLARELGSDQPLLGLQAQGLDDDQPLPASIEEAAALAVVTLRDRQPEGPYQLLGFSSGGLIAFEIARQLRAAGQTVSLLAMLDTALPSPDHGTLAAESLLHALAAELGCADLLDPANDRTPSTLADLIAAAQASHRLPEGFTLEHAERIARVFANTAAIHHRYRLIPTDLPVLLLRATRRQNPSDTPADWSPFLPPDSTIADLDCTHAGMVSREQAPAVAAFLQGRLA